MALAANVLGTMMFVKPEDCTGVLASYAANLIPCLSKSTFSRYTGLIQKSRMLSWAMNRGLRKP